MSIANDMHGVSRIRQALWMTAHDVRHRWQAARIKWIRPIAGHHRSFLLVSFLPMFAATQTMPLTASDHQVRTALYSFRTNTKRARADLEGVWIGRDEQIHFDQDAMQINFDPAKPFQWAPVQILDVTGKFYVLAVWNERYIVHLDGAALTLTRAGFSGSREFRKSVLAQRP